MTNQNKTTVARAVAVIITIATIVIVIIIKKKCTNQNMTTVATAVVVCRIWFSFLLPIPNIFSFFCGWFTFLEMIRWLAGRMRRSENGSINPLGTPPW